MHNKSGFSLIELITVIAIFAIFATIGTPAFLHWRFNSQIIGASRDLKADLELAKMLAIRENGSVSLRFSEKNNGYTVRIDNSGRVISSLSFSGDVTITSPPTINDGSSDKGVRFNGRGMPTDITSSVIISIVNGRNDRKQISVNRLGFISLQE